MKILVIHGDSTQKSYQRYDEALRKAKEKGWEIETSLDSIKKQSLFTNKRAAIIYFDKPLNKTDLNKIPKDAKIEEYKLPKLIFTFLESFYPKNYKKCLELLHSLTRDNPPEFILALLSKQLRDIYWIKKDPKTLSYPFWRIAKLKLQASYFSESLLREIISDFSNIDVESKTSKANLIDSLDLLIIQKLQ